MYTTLSPCLMCTGACLLYGVARVVLGENNTYLGGEELLRSKGVEVVNVRSQECEELMRKAIERSQSDWYVELEKRDHSSAGGLATDLLLSGTRISARNSEGVLSTGFTNSSAERSDRASCARSYGVRRSGLRSVDLHLASSWQVCFVRSSRSLDT